MRDNPTKRNNSKRQIKLSDRLVAGIIMILVIGLVFLFSLILMGNVPKESIRGLLFGCLLGVVVILTGWAIYLRKRVSEFSDELCLTLDALIAGREPENYKPYEDSLTSRVEGKLIQYYDIMQDGREQSQQDKDAVQSIVSDISHQVKTPIANVKMFTDILKEHNLTEEKKTEFLQLLDEQIHKLDFLMQSLVKMSRLETGIVTLNVGKERIYDTIAKSVDGVWLKAEQKDIQIEVECDSSIMVMHDPKWTVEALTNILDNGVKYTPNGGSVTITVRPWQFYTRIDIADTGVGMEEEEYHQVFKRFYRGQKTAAQEGVGLGLYLSQAIITKQKGYISIKSKPDEGTVFSIHLLS